MGFCRVFTTRVEVPQRGHGIGIQKPGHEITQEIQVPRHVRGLATSQLPGKDPSFWSLEVREQPGQSRENVNRAAVVGRQSGNDGIVDHLRGDLGSAG